jgi:uncharacterized membrane protein YphA (DoxX/SURF4 family)
MVGCLVARRIHALGHISCKRFWELAPASRVMAENQFFEHLGLVGGFLLVAWHDLSKSLGSRDL